MGTLTLPEIVPDLDPDTTTVDSVDIVHFWSCVLDMKTAGGDHAFRDLAMFALMMLSMPVSNAVIERVFSVLSLIKCRRRNRLQLRMLASLIRLRVHMKVPYLLLIPYFQASIIFSQVLQLKFCPQVLGICCTKFEPSQSMFNAFTAEMYKRHAAADVQPLPRAAAVAAAVEYEMEELIDDPPVMEAEVPVQEAGQEKETDVLEDIDYEIVNEIDTITLNEDLIIVRFDTQ